MLLAETLPPPSSVAEFTLLSWVGFGALVLILLALDLFVFHRHDHTPTLRESAGWTMFWILWALGFNAWVWWEGGSKAGLEFLSGYLIEKSLSMDNIFVFVVIFRFFQVPAMYQYRVLFWGILGAIVLRLVFILAGVELIHRFDWITPIFGAFLLYTAYKLARHTGAEVHPENNIILKTARRFLRVTRGSHQEYGHRFFVCENGRWSITPLFLVLLVVESTDVVFAVDSVPAILGITRDPFIAFTSNIFAILGLRALYFLLAGVVELFSLLNYGLAGVLGFVGVKMIAEWWIPHQKDEHLIPAWASLIVIVALLGTSIIASLIVQRRERPATTCDRSRQFGDEF